MRPTLDVVLEMTTRDVFKHRETNVRSVLSQFMFVFISKELIH